MAQDAPNNASFSFLVCLCLLVSFMVYVNALSFKLIHRDSVHSPLYPGRNLSDIEIVQRGMEISRARMSYLGSMISKARDVSVHPDVISPPIGYNMLLYMVDIAFGSPSKIQHLAMDTGACLTWIQCQPCISCYPQAYKIFEPAMSSTYSKLPCNHPLCSGSGFSCSGNDCVYQIIYGTPSSTKGVLSSETITSKAGQSLETVSNFAFGCSNENVDFPFDDSNLIGGLMGLGYCAQSIVTQLGPSARGRFSYCLQGFYSTLHSYLRFGSDAVINGNYQVTPLIRIGVSPLYYLYLIDISIGHHRMGFSPELFIANKGGHGGAIIDSGTSWGFLHPFASNKIEELLVLHFGQHNLERYYGFTEGLNLCYIYREDFTDYLSMTYHLKDADLVLPPKTAFFISQEEGFFCFSSNPYEVHTIVGAWQQHNMRFVYDAANTQLLFGPEDCSINP